MKRVSFEERGGGGLFETYSKKIEKINPQLLFLRISFLIVQIN